MRFLPYFAGTKPVYSDIPQIPGLLSAIFRLIEPRRNEIRVATASVRSQIVG
jgi:hypothetical protein